MDGNDGRYVVTLCADKLVMAIALSIPQSDDYFFEDNYFDMLPGREYKIGLTSGLSRQQIADSISFTTLYDATCGAE